MAGKARTPNQDLLAIEAEGFQVEIRAGENGYAKAFLAHTAGFRSLMCVHFLDNRRSAPYLRAAMRLARPREHLGQMLSKLYLENLPLVKSEFADWEALCMLQAIQPTIEPRKSSAGRL